MCCICILEGDPEPGLFAHELFVVPLDHADVLLNLRRTRPRSLRVGKYNHQMPDGQISATRDCYQKLGKEGGRRNTPNQV